MYQPIVEIHLHQMILLLLFLLIFHHLLSHHWVLQVQQLSFTLTKMIKTVCLFWDLYQKGSVNISLKYQYLCHISSLKFYKKIGIHYMVGLLFVFSVKILILTEKFFKKWSQKKHFEHFCEKVFFSTEFLKKCQGHGFWNSVDKNPQELVIFKMGSLAKLYHFLYKILMNSIGRNESCYYFYFI